MPDNPFLLKALENSSIGTWSLNLNTEEVTLSKFAAGLFGLEHDQASCLKADILNAVVSEDRERLETHLDFCINERDCFKSEFRMRHRSGEIRWLQCRGCVSDDADSDHAMTGVLFDITERKQIEHRLFDSEELFRVTAHSANDGIVIIDPDGKVVYWNESAERIFGYTSDETMGLRLDTLVVPQRYYLGFQHTLEKLKHHEYNELTKATVEQVARHKSGREIPLEISVSSMLKKGQRYCLWIVRDISERKAMEKALLESIERADAANQAKSDFLAHMSHEFRTPLNAIMGFSQLLGSDETLAEEHKDFAGEIIKASEHLNGVVSDVLDLARIESGRLHLDIEVAPLQLAIDEVMSLVSPLASEHDVRVSLETEMQETTRVMADSLRLRQIMINLLSNAIKYNKPGGRVNLYYSETKGVVRVAVNDTGRGIAAEDLNVLFQPFERLQADRAAIAGTGLGLVITRLLIEQQGGRIGVESQPGVGSTFWFELPSAEQDTLGVADELVRAAD